MMLNDPNHPGGTEKGRGRKHSHPTAAATTQKECSHYVVTAHPSGSVSVSCHCNFLSSNSRDVLIATPRRLELRQYQASGEFPLLLQFPNIHGNIIAMEPLRRCGGGFTTTPVFVLQERFRYAMIQYSETVTPYPLRTLASGSLASGGADATRMPSLAPLVGRLAETGPLVAVDPECRCIVLHLYDGLLTVLPINQQYVPPSSSHSPKSHTNHNATTTSKRQPSSAASSMLGEPYHCRIEERTVLAMTFLETTGTTLPLLCLLHQDSRGLQHVTSHVIQLRKKVLLLYNSPSAPTNTPWMKKSSVDGGSSLLLSIPPAPSFMMGVAASSAVMTTTTTQPPPPSKPKSVMDHDSNNTSFLPGGILVVGQRQLTYCGPGGTTRIVPVPPALYVSYDRLPDDPTTHSLRYLLGDEFGNLHMLSILFVQPSSSQPRVVALQLETLGNCTISSTLCYLEQGLCYVGSAMGDSQLIQIMDEPINIVLPPKKHDPDGAMNVDDYNHPSSTKDDDVADDVDLMDTTYLSVVEEYTNLGPILDFDLVPTTLPSNRGVAGGIGGDPTSSDNSAANTTTMLVTKRNPPQPPYPYQQSQVVTASGTSKSGTIRVIRNGIGMNEYASVDMAGIQAMWSIRQSFDDRYDTYLVQSFVGETRVLGVTSSSKDERMTDGDDADDVGGTLEEVVLPGLEPSASSLYVGNVVAGDCLLQITESDILLISNHKNGGGAIIDQWSGTITVAAANEAGQIVVAMAGGRVVYLSVTADQKIVQVGDKQMDREVSCINLHPFTPTSAAGAGTTMEIDDADSQNHPKRSYRSTMVAVGLWDDFTVRLLGLDQQLEERVCLHLSTTEDDDDENDDTGDDDAPDTPAAGTNQRRNRNNMMARSLCLITLDFASSSPSHASQDGTAAKDVANPGVNMLFVGLGDGTLISFAVIESMGVVQVQSKKEVCLGTQCINLVPLNQSCFFDRQSSHVDGGTCVLATGDRPTVIYLAGVGGAFHGHVCSSHQANPKLCYSTVNVASCENEEDGGGSRPPTQQAIAVNVAAPFYSPILFGGIGMESHQHYSLCVADDVSLRLGVIDDIQKLHVTTCRLGMAPRRIVYCPDGRLFAVGCIESGIKQFGFGGNVGDEGNMGNCIRFLDDTTFDDIDRVDLEPFEMILSMVYATMRIPAVARSGSSSEGAIAGGSGSEGYIVEPFLLVGTAYALPDEDEPSRGRILVYSCQSGSDGTASSDGRVVRQVTEFSVEGGVYCMTQFYDGLILATVNSRTHICRLVQEDGPGGMLKLQYFGNGHFGHILSLFVKSRAKRVIPAIESSIGSSIDHADGSGNTSKVSVESEEEMIAIVGDLMRSISLVQYFPQHQTLEEIARDFNVNWTTAIEMLTENVYLGAENWNNLYCLRRNTASSSEEVRCRLDTIGEFHLGEMCNKFMSGTLVMPVSSNASPSNKSAARRGRNSTPSKKADAISPSNSKVGGGSNVSRVRRPVVVVGSQTLFGTASGTLGVVLGMDSRTAAFFSTLERAMGNPNVIRPIGDFVHSQYRACHAERRVHPAHGFVDGDLVESFLDLDRGTMEAVVAEMNRDGGWEVLDDFPIRSSVIGQDKDEKDAMAADTDARPELAVDDVLAMVEEMTMLH